MKPRRKNDYLSNSFIKVYEYKRYWCISFIPVVILGGGTLARNHVTMVQFSLYYTYLYIYTYINMYMCVCNL